VGPLLELSLAGPLTLAFRNENLMGFNDALKSRFLLLTQIHPYTFALPQRVDVGNAATVWAG